MSLVRALAEDFLKHPQIDEVGLVFTPPPSTAVAHSLPESTKLALHVPAVPALVHQARTAAPSDEAAWLALVLCNPENHTAWAHRKRLLLAQQTSLAVEFHLCKLALVRLPKSGFAFEHMAWLFDRSVRAASTRRGRDAVIHETLDVCTELATRHRRLYYAWALRHRISQWLQADDVAAEMEWARAWMHKHVSDASCAAYLAALVRLWFDRDAALALSVTRRAKVLAAETQWIVSITASFPAHEALWTYRRHVASMWVDVARELVEKLSPERLEVALRTADVAPALESRRWWWCESTEVAVEIDFETALQVLLDEMNAPGVDVWAARYRQWVAWRILELVHARPPATAEVRLVDFEHVAQLPALVASVLKPS